ncbi:MAG: hypothetical protein Tsb0013_05120 [Phycisphaerales bacterium]
MRPIAPLVLLTLAGVAQSAPPTRLIALDGDTTQRTDGSVVTIARSADVSVGAGGDMYFSALAPGSPFVGDAIFVPGAEAGLRAFRSVLTTGEEAPGGSGFGFRPEVILQIPDAGEFGYPLSTRTSINASGDFVALHLLDGSPFSTFFNSIGLWRPDGDALRNTAISEIINGNLIVSPTQHVLVDDGRAFWSRFVPAGVAGAETGSALFVEENGVAGIAIGPGDPAPGTGDVFQSIVVADITPGGALAFRARLANLETPLPAIGNDGVWAGPLDDLRLVAREGDTAPVTGDPIYQSFSERVRTNNAGDVLFDASLSTGPGASVRGLMRERGGVLEAVVLQGDAAPGVPGAVFAGPDSTDTFVAHIGGGGDALLIASITGPGVDDTNDTGLWVVTDDEIELLAREGAPAPGASGTVFASFRGDPGPTQAGFLPARNNDSNYAFLAALRPGVGGVVEGVNDLGLWAYDPVAGGLALLARTGDDVDLLGDATDVRTIAGISFNPIYGLADNGYIAYTLDFGSGSTGVFGALLPTEKRAVCPGDNDDDGDVDLGDFGAFAMAFSTALGDADYDPAFDFDYDGDVDLGDFGAFGASFGRTDCPD